MFLWKDMIVSRGRSSRGRVGFARSGSAEQVLSVSVGQTLVYNRFGASLIMFPAASLCTILRKSPRFDSSRATAAEMGLSAKCFLFEIILGRLTRLSFIDGFRRVRLCFQVLLISMCLCKVELCAGRAASARFSRVVAERRHCAWAT